jgi:muconate cycloisomerase
MPSSRPPAATDDLARDLVVRSVTSWIVDVPTVRRHKLSSLSITAQSYVIVKLRLANGVDGIGEAAPLGGPRPRPDLEMGEAR